MQKKKNGLRHLSPVEKDALTEFVDSLRTKLGNNLIRIALFGSKVRGNYTHDSDLDILVILAQDDIASLNKIAAVTADIKLHYDVALSPVIFSEYDYQVNKNMKSPFALAVESECVML